MLEEELPIGVMGEEVWVLYDRSAGEDRKASAELRLPVTRLPARENAFVCQGEFGSIQYNSKVTHVQHRDHDADIAGTNCP
jgi:hypothetical protein